MMRPFWVLWLALWACVVDGHFSDWLGDPDLMTFMQNDYYGALGIAEDASVKQVKKAYRTLSKEFHPDRNPGFQQRFLDIAAANEVLSNTAKRERYDQFLKDVPAQFRPRYGKRLVDARAVVAIATALIISLISCAQNAQYKRERKRALGSEFYAQALEAAKEKGRSEQDFFRTFLLANPELERTWRDTLGGKLLFFFSSSSSRKTIVEQTPLEGEELPSESEEDEQVDELVLPPIPEDASREEKKRLEKEHRKLIRKHQQRVQQLAQRKAARKKQRETAAKRDALREEQRAAKEEERKRVEKLEQERQLERALETREALVENVLDPVLLMRMIDQGSDSLCVFLHQLGLVPNKDANFTVASIEPNFDGIKQKLLELVRTDDLDQEIFWEDVFDNAFLDWEEEQREKAQAEQDAYEQEQRRAMGGLLAESDDETDAVLVAGAEGEEDDDEWGKELAAKEAAKKAKKEAAKQEKMKKAEANKAANELKKKSQTGKKGGKKEKRRR